MSLETVLAEVRAERERQDQQWGGPNHDDDHSSIDWLCFLEEYTTRASDAVDASADGEYRRRIVQVAALAVAAVESFDRKEATTHA